MAQFKQDRKLLVSFTTKFSKKKKGATMGSTGRAWL